MNPRHWILIALFTGLAATPSQAEEGTFERADPAADRPREPSMPGADYTGLKHSGADFTGMLHSGADYTGLRFSGADYTGAVLQKRDYLPAKPPPPPKPPAPGTNPTATSQTTTRPAP